MSQATFFIFFGTLYAVVLVLVSAQPVTSGMLRCSTENPWLHIAEVLACIMSRLLLVRGPPAG